MLHATINVVAQKKLIAGKSGFNQATASIAGFD